MGRVLLIGIDGAEPTLLERWMDSGDLPHLAALRARGAFMPCASTVPPATFPAWTTCVTGVNPGRHGIFDFTQLMHETRQLRFVNSTYRDAPALWNILSEAGKRVCVLGVPGTYPPEPVNGIMVSGFDSPVCTAVDASFVYPANAFEDVKEWRFADFQESTIGEGWHEDALRKLLDGVATKERIACSLAKREPWDFFMIVFGESDTVSHHFWLFHDPASPRFREGFSDAIQQVYRRIDEAVGALIEASGEDVTVMIVSDHGFGGSGDGVVHLNNWLAERGYLKTSAHRESFAKRIARQFVPPSWRGALFRRLSGFAARAESHARFAGIDWPHTMAWSEELNYFPSIRINLRGRDPEGIVPASEYDAFCRALCDELKQWEHIANAWPRSTLYDGPHLDRAPDIIVELALENGHSPSCLRSRGGPAFRRLARHEHFGGKERGMTGNHRPIGSFMISQPVPTGFLSLEDVTPTVLSLVQVPAPPMDGTSLFLTGAGIHATSSPRMATPYAPEQEQLVEARLRDLGYFE